MLRLPKILYNVSFNTKNLDPILTPKIPETAGYDEDETIPRVCLADSIEHCIQAIAHQNRRLRVDAEIVIREINTDQLDPILITTPDTLFKRQLVPDAIENQEYWYEDKIICKIRVEKIKDFDFFHDLAWSCLELERNIVHDIINQFPNNLNFNAFKTAKEAYQAFIDDAEKQQQWNDIDNIWERLSNRPWAQKMVIRDIEFY